MQLVERRLPAEHEVTSDADAWPLVGAALLSRITTMMRDVLRLQVAAREADAATLARSLYEHVVHFAWLAAEPTAERLEAWRKVDLQSRLTADNKSRELNEPLFSDTERAQLEVGTTPRNYS
jgi:hypothetical protein